MTPKEFVFPTDYYNTPYGQIEHALNEPIKIVSKSSDWEVLSYYHDDLDGCMVLEIKKAK